MARPRKFPQTLRRDSISVSIYKTKTNEYETFTVSYYDEGKRRRIVRGSYEEAKKEADLRLTQFAAGLTSDKQLHGDDRAAYLAAFRSSNRSASRSTRPFSNTPKPRRRSMAEAASRRVRSMRRASRT